MTLCFTHTDFFGITKNHYQRRFTMAKKGKKSVPDCEAYGVAFDDDDEECAKCDVMAKCKALTEGESDDDDEPEDKPEKSTGKKGKAGKTGKKAGKKVGKKGKKPAEEDPDDPDDEPEDDEPEDDEPEDDEPEDDEPEDDEPEDGDDSTILKRLKSLEQRVADLAEKIEAGGGKKKSGRGLDKDAKEEKKAELLAGMPYSKDDLGEMKNSEVKMLCSALTINSFGMSKDDAISEIVKVQKKKDNKGGKKKK